MIDPVAFSIYGISIYWYGIFYVLGFIFAYYFIMNFASDFGFKKEKIEDIFFYTMIFSVIGGRIGFILFYSPIYYLNNPLEIFSVWNGGMSIHGGFLGTLFSLIFFSRKEKLNLLKLTDLFSIPTFLGLAFGRLANFINQELVGKITTSNFGVVFPLYDENKRWPSTIFEGFKNLIGFQILLYLHFFKQLKGGILTAYFLIIYNFGRFFINFIREPTLSLGIISMGQLLCLIFGFAGIILLWRINNK
jgi:phosphatidylglycerol:prolipoprotein diacylglycerol transferase